MGVISHELLSIEELNYLNILREKYALPSSEFERIMSGISLMNDKQFRTPAGYDAEKNKRLLVDMIVAVSVPCRNYASPAFTQITGEIGALARGMKGITFDQAKFERLFHLTFEAEKVYQLINNLKQIEDYVIARW